ncbi:MAG: ABC transporter ATP-binding protein [Candidatus Binatus sp.]|uniref:ABC transporter ATP-binding protein n=1 Tax=Candidatus Binatus sp. TaxID=2811406 RepID=UPI003BAED083
MFNAVLAYTKSLAAVARWRLGYTFALVVLSSLTEGLGLALLLPTLQLAGVDMGSGSAAGRYAAAVREGFGVVGLRPTLALMLALFVAIICVRAMVTRAQGMAITVLFETFAQHLRQRLFEAVSGANWLFICKSRSSDFVHALTNEVDRASGAAHQGLYTVSGAAIAALYIAASFILFPASTLLMLALCAVLGLLLRAKTRAVYSVGTEVSDVTNSVYAAAIEHFQSIKTAKMYGAQRRTCDIFSGLTREMTATGLRLTNEQLSADAWFEIGSAVMMGGMLLVAIKWMAISPAEVLILLVLFARVLPRIRSVQTTYRGFVGLLPGFATVTRIEEQCRAAAEPDADVGQPLEFRSSLRFENVSFTYPPGTTPVLRGIDLTIPVGRTVAIVGPSGAGKSTIADLVMGLMPAGSGRITVDGTPLNPARALSWREGIGYVAQDTFLFHDTVRANLLWARPGATENELRDALRKAAADEFVARLPQGLDTIVGDRGATLSQGERQRLALARAILRQPRLLLLDESTNSLDSENEARILGAIEQMQDGITTVLIAHRLSTIRWADLIYVIEDGRVVESGDWTTLSARLDGRFRSWCVAQGLAA